MNRLAIILILFEICTYPVANARARNAFALPNYVIAPYQVCILTGYPIYYGEIEKVHPQNKFGLAGAADVLGRIGFSAKIKRMSYNTLRNDKLIHIIQGEKGRLLVLTRRGRNILAYDYPRKPIEFDRSMVSIWPTPVLAIEKVPTRKLGRSPLIITPQLHDFGVVDAGTIVKTTFDLWNPSSKKITLLGMATSCGCTIMDGKLGPLAPDTHRQFVVTFNSIWKWGYGDWTCVIDTDQGPIVVLLSGCVRSAKDYFPHQIAFGDIILGQHYTLSVRFMETDHGDRSPIVDVSAPKWIKISMHRSIDPYWHAKSYLLNITIAPGRTMIGKLTGAVDVKYMETGKLKQASIPVSGYVHVASTTSELHVIRNVVPNVHEGMHVRLDNMISYTSIKDFKVTCSNKGISILKRSSHEGHLVLDLFCHNKVESAVAQVAITSVEHHHAKRLIVVLVISSRQSIRR